MLLINDLPKEQPEELTADEARSITGGGFPPDDGFATLYGYPPDDGYKSTDGYPPTNSFTTLYGFPPGEA